MKKLFVFLALFMLLPFNVNAEEMLWDETGTYWTEFVEAYKNSELGIKNGEIIITGDGYMEIQLGGNETYYFTFTYNNGVMTYIPSQFTSTVNDYTYSNSDIISTTSSLLTEEKEFVENAISVLCDLKSCAADNVIELINEGNSLTLEDNGISYTMENYVAVADFKYYTSLQLNLADGIVYTITGDPVLPSNPDNDNTDTGSENENTGNESDNTGSENDNVDNGNNETTDDENTGNIGSNINSSNNNDDDIYLDGPSLEYTPEEDCDPEQTPEQPTKDPVKEETVKNPETGLFNNYGV